MKQTFLIVMLFVFHDWLKGLANISSIGMLDTGCFVGEFPVHISPLCTQNKKPRISWTKMGTCLVDGFVVVFFISSGQIFFIKLKARKTK